MLSNDEPTSNDEENRRIRDSPCKPNIKTILPKPKYPKASQLPLTDLYYFDKDAQGIDWLIEDENDSIDYVTEHALEYRFAKDLVESLSKTDSLAASRLNQKYRSWVREYASHTHRDVSCLDKIKDLFGITANKDVLCGLDQGLN
ncbi:hypothetical protein FQN54_004118 [Arachnomyces sp. PD_36]|nr:hypothetical protein FQN54_004118 [Arachnomyces sp. PD_36]